MFPLKPVPAAELTEQLTRFVPLLFRAAGYAGWCILLDELELIGRYTPLQRALVLCLARRPGLGWRAARRFPGIVAAYAITDDFATAVINARLDSEKLPERLTAEGTRCRGRVWRWPASAISRTRCCGTACCRPRRTISPCCHDKVRHLYGAAYDWPAPPLPPAERTSSRTMRQYIKGWITQWDLLRLEGSEVRLVSEGLASNYSEDATLAEPPELSAEEP